MASVEGKNYFRKNPSAVTHSEASHRAFNGPCNLETRRCSSTTDFQKKTNPCCVRINRDVLAEVALFLNRLSVPWHIDYGTLLGYMKNGGFYWNDKDTDVCVLASDREKVSLGRDFLRLFKRKLVYKPPVPGVVFEHGDVLKVIASDSNRNSCDITFWKEREDGILYRDNYAKADRFKGREYPKSWAFPTTRGEWEDLIVNVPAEPELLVRYRFGPEWRNLPAVRYVPIPRG